MLDCSAAEDHGGQNMSATNVLKITADYEVKYLDSLDSRRINTTAIVSELRERLIKLGWKDRSPSSQ